MVTSGTPEELGPLEAEVMRHVSRFVAEAESQPAVLRRTRELLDANPSDAPSAGREAV